MLPLLITAGMCATVSDGLDWSQASDDLRIASIKPVMTLKEVERLRTGREHMGVGCGVAHNEYGHMVGFYSNIYILKPTSHGDNGVGLSFQRHGPDKEIAGSVGMVVGVQVNGVAYRHNSAGLFVVQPSEWTAPLVNSTGAFGRFRF